MSASAADHLSHHTTNGRRDMAELRPNLPALPDRIARLPRDHRGFPVPWFVQWYKEGVATDRGVGIADFRVVDTRCFNPAVRQRLCWTCGQKLGTRLAFVIGPMCAINRTISEPPSHFECAEFSAKACPFLTQPRMRRNEKNMPTDTSESGFGLKRNPGAVCLWVTRTYKPFKPPIGGGVLFEIGPPERVLWLANGRPATRAEVVASIDSGFPELKKLAELEGKEAIDELYRRVAVVQKLLPQDERVAA